MSATNKNITVLVVEDDDIFREVVCAWLESYGFAVVEAADGEQGLRIAESQRVDAIISDIRMPKMDGVEMLKRLRATKPDYPIVFIVSGFANYSESEILALGANGFLMKPYDINKVSEQIIELVHVP